MRPWGRRALALVGLLGTLTGGMCLSVLCKADADPTPALPACGAKSSPSPHAVGLRGSERAPVSRRGAARPCAVRADTIKTEVELTTKEIGSKEETLGDMAADALKDSAKTDAAFIAATSFNDSASFPKGSVDISDLIDVLVYKSESVVIVKLTGEQITRALEQSLFLYPKSNSAFLQTSGLVVTVKADADAGKRVVSIKIGGNALEPKRVYRVAMPAPLAHGGLAYFKIWSKSNIEKDTDTTVETAFSDWLSSHKTITKGEERLVIKNR